ncbi:MAG TPA: geranylgeranylglyceryl/heptaprenylglyceryl phosphate synthase [Nitrososphaerales archaeon]|nr:geranylgeranylglyceryl/heptaprenylglyceryl phosphate synthase [Nitrososphaerales archaeon]
MWPLLRQVESKLKDLIKSQGTICVGLLDSENISPNDAAKIAARVEKCGAKAILVGGSTAIDQIELEEVVKTIKKAVTSPVILFPGNVTGVSPSADAIFFSCLMNSDNPYFITEAQALGALSVRKYDLEALPMAYLIVGDGGAAGFVGRAKGIPHQKPGLAAMYALAAQYFGMRFLYLEAGSGADGRVSEAMIAAVRKVYGGTLIVGGGINSPEAAKAASKAGADVIVVGTMLENDDFEPILTKICKAISHK